MAEDPDVFVAKDQLERELIWDALAEYRRTIETDHGDVLDAMIKRVASTFPWTRS